MKVHIGNYLRSGKPRKISVQIDPWDLHSLDYTLAKVIHPALIAFRDNLKAHPPDVTLAEWKEIINKMALAFELMMLQVDAEAEAEDEHERREHAIHEGFQLFIKWYRALWN